MRSALALHHVGDAGSVVEFVDVHVALGCITTGNVGAGYPELAVDDGECLGLSVDRDTTNDACRGNVDDEDVAGKRCYKQTSAVNGGLAGSIVSAGACADATRDAACFQVDDHDLV